MAASFSGFGRNVAARQLRWQRPQRCTSAVKWSCVDLNSALSVDLGGADVQVWWVWYLWISPVFWSVYGLLVTQLGDITQTMVLQNGTVTQVGVYFPASMDPYSRASNARSLRSSCVCTEAVCCI
jgi:hypothetical protein